jgi:hypothetical protein
MKLSKSLLLPAVLGTASAALDSADVYLLQGKEWPSQSTPPTLSPGTAALVVAQRLGISQYYNLDDATDEALNHINTFGGSQHQLFSNNVENDARPQLLLMIDKAPSAAVDAFKKVNPAFKISSPPSDSASVQFLSDVQAQIGRSAVANSCSLEDRTNPFMGSCWNGKTSVVSVSYEKVWINDGFQDKKC